MANTWLLTWTTYGTWLPGDPRGSVTRVREGAQSGGPRVEYDQPGTAYIGAVPGLARAAANSMRGPPIWLTQSQAEHTLAEFKNTAAYRQWSLLAAAIMTNQVHLVLCAPDELSSSKLMQILKSYASRKLNQQFGKPRSETWWTSSGSKRRLPDDRAVRNAVNYVRKQHRPLAMHIAGDP